MLHRLMRVCVQVSNPSNSHLKNSSIVFPFSRLKWCLKGALEFCLQYEGFMHISKHNRITKYAYYVIVKLKIWETHIILLFECRVPNMHIECFIPTLSFFNFKIALIKDFFYNKRFYPQKFLACYMDILKFTISLLFNGLVLCALPYKLVALYVLKDILYAWAKLYNNVLMTTMMIII